MLRQKFPIEAWSNWLTSMVSRLFLEPYIFFMGWGSDLRDSTRADLQIDHEWGKPGFHQFQRARQ